MEKEIYIMDSLTNSPTTSPPVSPRDRLVESSAGGGGVVNNNNKDSNITYDEYNFPVEDRLLDDYRTFLIKHEKRRELLLTEKWKDVQLTVRTDRKKLKDLVHAGVPKEFRARLWSCCGGAERLKEGANANSESGSYWSELLEKLKKTKPSDVSDEILKDISRTFPGHPQIESEEGQDKLRRVLECFAKRNKSIGYCQSMNFLAGISLIVSGMEEEDAFWLLTNIVETHCTGMYSKAMMSIQIDSNVFSELISEKLPDLYKHMQTCFVSTLLISTKWFMCLFVGALPTETCFRVWDYFFLHGVRILFIAGIAVLTLLQEDLLKTKDTMKFCDTLMRKSTNLFDWKELIKVMTKQSDITDERIDDLRLKHKSTIGQELSPEALESFREQFNQTDSNWGGAGIFNVLSTTYESVSGKLDSWYKRSRENYGKMMTKRQVEKAKTVSAFEFSVEKEAKLFECVTNHIQQPVDFTVQGIGARLYPGGRKYKGSFKANKRDGYGVLHDVGGRVEYNGYWKNDKKDGTGTNTDANGNIYKGDWRSDEYHGKGALKLLQQNITYDGEWRNNKMDGRGVMVYSNGDKYDGEWRNNKREGTGTFVWTATGNRYEGSWKNDKQEGKGVMLYATGDAYDGEWKDNLPQGRGVMLYASGEKYAGDWVLGKREGRGILSMLTSDQYDGEWKGDKMNGHGTIIRTLDGSRLEGTFKDGLRIEGNAKYLPTGERVPEPKHDDIGYEAKSENYKESIMTKVKGSSGRDSSLSSLSRKPNSSLTKAIEDIKRKNSATS